MRGHQPAANVEKMASVTPLTDKDRWPWLRAVGAWISGREAKREPALEDALVELGLDGEAQAGRA